MFLPPEPLPHRTCWLNLRRWNGFQFEHERWMNFKKAELQGPSEENHEL